MPPLLTFLYRTFHNLIVVPVLLFTANLIFLHPLAEFETIGLESKRAVTDTITSFFILEFWGHNT